MEHSKQKTLGINKRKEDPVVRWMIEHVLLSIAICMCVYAVLETFGNTSRLLYWLVALYNAASVN